jgi:hypothetical protein
MYYFYAFSMIFFKHKLYIWVIDHFLDVKEPELCQRNKSTS